jgi:protoheme IX farnesyltransferase
MLLPYNNRLLQLVHRLAADPDSLTNAKSLFRWSILYLFGICLLLILSRSALAAHLDQQMIAMLMQLGVA